MRPSLKWWPAIAWRVWREVLSSWCCAVAPTIVTSFTRKKQHSVHQVVHKITKVTMCACVFAWKRDTDRQRYKSLYFSFKPQRKSPINAATVDYPSKSSGWNLLCCLSLSTELQHLLHKNQSSTVHSPGGKQNTELGSGGSSTFPGCWEIEGQHKNKVL